MKWLRRRRKLKGCELSPFLITLIGEVLLEKYLVAMAREAELTDLPFKEVK